MTSMVGNRVFVYFTGTELPSALPINQGRPMAQEGFYTLLGEITEEVPGGLWFRLERIFDPNNEPMGADFSDKPEYFLSWNIFRRALLAKPEEVKQPPKLIGFHRDG